MTGAFCWIIGSVSVFVVRLLYEASRSPCRNLYDYGAAGRPVRSFVLRSLALCVFSAAVGSWSYCHAEEVKNGFRDTRWGQPPAPDMTPCDWRTNGPPSMEFVQTIGKRAWHFMVRKNDRLQIGNVPLRAIEYVFVENQLRLVRAFPKHRADWGALEKLLTEQYGKPEDVKKSSFAYAIEGLANANSCLWYPSDCHGVFFLKLGWYDKSAPYYIEFYDRKFFETPPAEAPPASPEQVKKDL